MLRFVLYPSPRSVDRWAISGYDFSFIDQHQCRSAFVLHEDRQELGRPGVARVPANNVDVLRTFVERLSSRQRHRPSSLHLHHYRPLQHIDELSGTLIRHRRLASNAAIEILKVHTSCSPHGIGAGWMARRSLLLEGSPSTQ